MADPVGVLICGHGSRDPKAVAEFAAFAARLAPRFDAGPVAHAYLEFARPVIADGLDRLLATGARHILAAPAMLLAAGHTKDDIPSVLNAWQARRPGVRVEYGRDLGLDPKMVRAAAGRIGEALASAAEVPVHETVLLVVGRGTSDSDANADVAKLTRLLWEGLGFGWAETAFSGVTFPLVEPALERAARLGFRRIVVFPYFLFTGVLVGRIYDAADRAGARHPGIEIVKAPYLGDHPLVMETFVERVAEIPAGAATMNCQGCKYRAPVLGFEDAVGRPQASHHHHVEGIGAGNGHDPSAHAHRPGHPHADHPFGPVSLKQG
jgi:sirohydrochlorin cobaltochelatase